MNNSVHLFLEKGVDIWFNFVVESEQSSTERKKKLLWEVRCENLPIQRYFRLKIMIYFFLVGQACLGY